jgi:hypothetical protein
MLQNKPSVWIVGDWRHATFAAAMRWLNARTRCDCFEHVHAAVAASTDRSESPSAIMLVQSRPGQLTSYEVERLHVAAPLARLVALVGPWCDGELRSGQPWPGVVRVPWQTWQAALTRELAIDAPTTPLPRTATDVERMQELAALRRSVSGLGRTVVICTFNRATFDSLADALERWGYLSYWHSGGTDFPPRHFDLIVLDGWDQVSRSKPSGAIYAPRLMLLHFPRPEDTARAAELGITAIVGQPLLVSDLDAVLSFCGSQSLDASGQQSRSTQAFAAL